MLIRMPEPELEEGDILVRPKKSGGGFHYGTVIRAESVLPGNALVGIYPKFLAAHTMPQIGKQPDTIDGFFDGMQGWRVRPDRSPMERQTIEQRAVSDFGRPYAVLDSCETDITRVHTGIASNPTASRIGGGIAVVLGLVGLIKLLND